MTTVGCDSEFSSAFPTCGWRPNWPRRSRPLSPPAATAGCVSLRIVVVSPFVDRRHGTERAIAELIDRLASRYGCEVHLFAQRVADLAVVPAGTSGAASPPAIYWHRVPAIPGPQLLRFVALLVLNRLQRSGHTFDLVLSPGINCADADVVIVHALFRRLSEMARASSRETASPGFLRSLHRRLYYSLVSWLETRIYSDRRVALAA